MYSYRIEIATVFTFESIKNVFFSMTQFTNSSLVVIFLVFSAFPRQNSFILLYCEFRGYI